ncbi:MAG: topoisomerase IV [Oscillospiraceae bacterium]|jgi:DNA gyrase subunit A|nr:topoisomerase IV [Oscillospiraceae bacterium]
MNRNDVYIEGMGVVVEEAITKTLETNYMPYAMSVILSRAIPEIDGFKPSHRKLLYTMYKMGLLTGGKTKSANVVGQTMRLNPHGDAAIYETMVRLSKGNESLLCPFVESKGNFGKVYSRDMAYAASRYTEVKLSEICYYVFEDIDKDTVNFVDNYDNTMKEPTLLPVAFPNILANPNLGIAVGMTSSICSFNLAEICETTIQLIKNANHNLAATLPAPDFSTGGAIIYNEEIFDGIYKTGRGSFKVRGTYRCDEKANCILITEIPPTTTIEAIIDKIIENMKTGKLKEIVDVRDEADLKGLRIAIDFKRGIDPERLVSKLFKLTPLEDSFSCNFNLLVGLEPKTLGVRAIIFEWLEFRKACVKRKLSFELRQMKLRLDLLTGLEKILLDIDRAIKVIRGTKRDLEVLPNLMREFDLNEGQAAFIAEIKLRNLNKEYILKRIKEIKSLSDEIKWTSRAIDDEKEIEKLIIKKLEEIIEKHGEPRKSSILKQGEIVEPVREEIKNYEVQILMTKGGYLKKMHGPSSKTNSDHKLKSGDKITHEFASTNLSELLIFTNKANVYRLKCYELEDIKVGQIGVFLPAKVAMEEGELPVYIVSVTDYAGDMIFAFENGRFARVSLASFNMTNRKKMSKAFNQESAIVFFDFIKDDQDYVVYSKGKKLLVFNSGLLNQKVTRDTRGVRVMKLRVGDRVIKVKKADAKQKESYLVTNIPRSGFAQRVQAKQLEIDLP